jgi:type I restriction enzyme, S subunit
VIENSIVQNLAALKSLPLDWSVYSFEEVVKDVSGGNKKTLKSDFLDEGEFLIVDQGQSLIAGFTNNKELLVKELPPYVVFGDHTRAFKYVAVPFAMGADGTKVLKPKNNGILLEKYLYYFFLTLEIPNTGYNRHFKYLKTLKIPLPPLAEQQKIATILDAADSLRQKDRQLIDHYTALSQSLFLEMFGDPVANPMGWESLCLNEMMTFLTSGSRGWAQYYSDDGDLFLRIQNVGKNQLLLKDVAYVKAPDDAEAKRTTVEAGDILLSITADLGRTAVIPKELARAHINQHLAIIRLEDKYEPYYVSEYISSMGGKRQFMQLDKGGVKAGLNFTDIKTLSILNPPIELQKQYVERSLQIIGQKQLAQASLEHSEVLFNSLLQQAFTGQLTAKRAA